MENSKVSVIITNYNYKQYIEECIKSVLHQDYPNLEIVIVDDDSTDGSDEVIREISQRNNNIRVVILEKNGGVSNARNIGVKEAEGEYITFLDADDYYGSKTVISSEISLIKKMKGKCAAYAKAAFLNDAEFSYKEDAGVFDKIRYRISNSKEGLISGFVSGIYVSAGLCYKKEFFGETGGFDMNLSLHEDTDYLIRLGFLIPFRCTYSLGVVHRVKTGGLSDKNEKEYFRVLEEIRHKYYGKLSIMSKIMVHIYDVIGIFQILKNRKI